MSFEKISKKVVVTLTVQKKGSSFKSTNVNTKLVFVFGVNIDASVSCHFF